MPEYIQAIEPENPKQPGTIARLQLRWAAWSRPAASLSAPIRIPSSAREDGRPPLQADGDDVGRAGVRQLDIPRLRRGDVLGRETPPAGASREVGFAYGLGDVAASESGGKLRLTTGGYFTPGGEFTVTA